MTKPVLYQHYYRGEVAEVIGTALNDNLDPVVVYRMDGRLYTMAYDRFHHGVAEKDGKTVPLFDKVSE